MRAIDADALEKEGWSLHRTIRVDMNTEEYQTKPLKQVPTIELQRKKGKWLFKERREPVYDISGVKTWGISYMCSECGFIHTVIEDFGQYAYCPNSNCGAEMEGQDDRK